MPKIFITFILLSGSLIIGLFYLRPQWQQFGTLRLSAENLRNISAELDELIQNRDALTKTISAVSKTDLGKIDLALPQGPRSAEFLTLLEALAQKNKIILKQVNLSEPLSPAGGLPKPGGNVSLPSASTFREIPVVLNVGGSYESFKSFLSDLEKNLRIIDIESVSFSGSGNNQFDFSIRGKTYYQ
jgi:Tfp pilus assembly protein PilO